MPLAWTRAAAQWHLASKHLRRFFYHTSFNSNRTLCSCRKTQGVFDKCMKDNFDWDRPSYGYFARAKVSYWLRFLLFIEFYQLLYHIGHPIRTRSTKERGTGFVSRRHTRTASRLSNTTSQIRCTLLLAGIEIVA